MNIETKILNKIFVCVLSHVFLSVAPWTAPHQAPFSMEFSRLDIWSGLPFPPPGDLPDQGIKPASLMSPALASRFFTTNATSIQFSRSVVSDSLRPHESQHARPPCPSPSPGVHSDSRPLSPSCHPAISNSVVLFSSCPQSLPASESFPMSHLFA